MAKRTLADVVSELELQTEYLDLTYDRFGEFLSEMQAQQTQATLDRMEASREIGAAPSVSSEEIGVEDVVQPSKEAGILASLGQFLKGGGGAILAGGLGIGAAGAGLGYLISQINDLGPSMTRLSEGLTDLENTEVTGEQFQKLGAAIANLVSGAGIGGALGIRVLAGTAFEDLANGINALNGIQVDVSAMEQAGEGINALLAPLNAFDLGEAGVLQMVDDNLTAVAAGVDALAKAEVPSVEKMEQIGEGIDKMLAPLSANDIGEATVLGMIDDNLKALADGLNLLNTVDPAAFSTIAPIIGKGIEDILDGTDDLAGAGGLQMIDDNLMPLADAINYMVQTLPYKSIEHFNFLAHNVGNSFETLMDGLDDLMGATGMQMIDDNLMPLTDGIKYMVDTLDMTSVDRMNFIASNIGPAFEQILDGTDDLMGTTGLQAIDDNLIPLADGIKYMSDTGSQVDVSNVGKIVDAVNEIDRIESVDMRKVRKLGTMLQSLTPMNTQRSAAIQSNTEDTQSGNVTVINNTNAPTNVQSSTSNIQATHSLPSPVNNNGSRVDAYSAG